jgi:hypothetical protein
MDLYQISKISVKSSGNQRRQPQGIYGASLKIAATSFRTFWKEKFQKFELWIL